MSLYKSYLNRNAGHNDSEMSTCDELLLEDFDELHNEELRDKLVFRVSHLLLHHIRIVLILGMVLGGLIGGMIGYSMGISYTLAETVIP